MRQARFVSVFLSLILLGGIILPGTPASAVSLTSLPEVEIAQYLPDGETFGIVLKGEVGCFREVRASYLEWGGVHTLPAKLELNPANLSLEGQDTLLVVVSKRTTQLFIQNAKVRPTRSFPRVEYSHIGTVMHRVVFTMEKKGGLVIISNPYREEVWTLQYGERWEGPKYEETIVVTHPQVCLCSPVPHPIVVSEGRLYWPQWKKEQSVCLLGNILFVPLLAK